MTDIQSAVEQAQADITQVEALAKETQAVITLPTRTDSTA